TFIPPLRFAVVEPHLYRGSYPRPLNLGFLESLKLKTIISLTPEPLSQDIQRWAHSHDISLVHFAPVKGSKKEAPLDNSEATKVVELALNPENAPMYIHCLNGSEVTSIAICALRKLQFWSHPVIFSEMIRFSDIHSYSERFLENFGGVDTGVDIVIPKRRVAWL
ncbi:protein-tyrosine phosphatase, partial [Xylona heveae TC161]